MSHQVHHHQHSKAHTAWEFPTRRSFVSFLISAAVLAPRLLGQTQIQNPIDTAERFRQMSEDYEKEGLAAPFQGITTDGTVVPGVSRLARQGFLLSLSETPPRGSSLR